MTILVAVVLVACGDGGDTTDDAVAVEKTIVASARSENPADCGRIYTRDFLDRMAAGFGADDPLKFCEEVVEEDIVEGTRGVTVEDVRIDGGEATAEASFEGSSFDGQTVSLALVREEGDWKIDRFVEFVEFDRDRLLESMERELDEVADATGETELTNCVAGSFEELEDAELEDLALYKDPDGKLEIVETCIRVTERDRSL